MGKPPIVRPAKKTLREQLDEGGYRGVYTRKELKQFLTDHAASVFDSLVEVDSFILHCHASLGGQRIRPDPEIVVEFVDGERLILVNYITGTKLVFFFRNNQALLYERETVIVKGRK